MRHRFFLFAFLWTIALLVAACGTAPVRPTGIVTRAPVTVTSSQTDVYHGVSVSDPYRWLEKLDDPDVHAWVEAQNEFTKPALAALPGRERFRQRMMALWNYERFGASLSGGHSYVVPEEHTGRLFYLHNDGTQDQSVLMVIDEENRAPRVLLDPNALSKDHATALSGYSVSPDGTALAYTTSDGGTDWKTIRIRSVLTGADLAESMSLVKFTGIGWSHDSHGFYYSRYPVREDGHGGDDSRQVSIWYHALGTPQESDRFVYAVTNHTTRNPYATVSDDGRQLVIHISDGYAQSGVMLLDLNDPDADAVPLLATYEARYDYLGNEGDVYFFLTTADASNGRIIAVNRRHPEKSAWRTVVAEAGEAIDGVQFSSRHFFIRYLKDAHSVVRVADTEGHLRELDLPGMGEAVGFDGDRDASVLYYAYTDYLTPQAIYRLDLKDMSASLFRAPKVAFDSKAYVTEQVFYASKDGTRIPMYITHRRDVAIDGKNPTMLYGYGGFNLPQLPAFSVPVAVWLEKGGVYAVANLRGGSEYGEAWHRAGTKLQKQNVFDDFIAAAEWLQKKGWTSRDHLVIRGRSNGGLLVGATLTQRPDLFAAALPAVGVMDMLRYQTASANARGWSSDFGLSEDAAEFAALRAYSPVHNARNGTCYPSTLVTTAEHDDRVVPWHSYKFAAALQAAQAPNCPNPILLRVETRAGHGNDRPIWMQVEDYAEQWAFAAVHTGFEVAP
jgi:prolyl oligopeptidase